MVALLGGVEQTGSDVFRFKIGVIGKDFPFTGATGKQRQHILHADAQAPDARPSAALIRAEGDAI